MLLSPKPIRPEEQEEMDRLCRSMHNEKDTAKLVQILRQLQELLDRRQPEIVGEPRGVARPIRTVR